MSEVPRGLSAYAKANAVCCQIASGCLFVAALGLLIGGSILVNTYREIGEDFFFDDMEDVFENGNKSSDVFTKYSIGVAMLFFGCCAASIASILLCCSCGFAAFSEATRVDPQIPQPQMATTIQHYPPQGYFNQAGVFPNPPTTPYPPAIAYETPPPYDLSQQHHKVPSSAPVEK